MYVCLSLFHTKLLDRFGWNLAQRLIIVWNNTWATYGLNIMCLWDNFRLIRRRRYFQQLVIHNDVPFVKLVLNS